MTRQAIALAVVLAAFLTACNELTETPAYQVTPPPPPEPLPPAPAGKFFGPLTPSIYSYAVNADPYRIRAATSYQCDHSAFEVTYDPLHPSSTQSTRCLSSVLTLDGGVFSADDLSISFFQGQLVELDVPEDSQLEATMDIRRTVLGRVESIDAAHARLVLLGQQIMVSDLTRFAGNHENGEALSLWNIAKGDRLAISGHFSADGLVAATRIAAAAENEPVVLRGILHGEPGRAFSIGSLEVDLSAAVIEGFPGGTPLAGDSVLLFANQDPSNGVLNVSNARFAGGNKGTGAHDTYRYTGFMTKFESPTNFQISGYDLDYSNDTCVECSELVLQQEKIPAGTLMTSGCCDADGNTHLWLSSIASNASRIVGPIVSIDTATGSMNVLGFDVQVLPATHISDSQHTWVGSRILDIAELAPGETVTVQGGALGTALVAGMIARTGAGRQVSSIRYTLADPAILIAGRNVLTNDTTTVEACDMDGICVTGGANWLFTDLVAFQEKLSYPPTLTIDVEIDGDTVRAIHVQAFSYGWVF